MTAVDATWDRVLRAAKLMVGGLSYADCFACGLAAERGATLLSGDPEFPGADGIGVIRPPTSQR